MKTNHQSQPWIARLSTLITLGAIILLGCSQSVVAQWTTSSNGPSNINNTNTGNVGIGTSAPDAKLQVHHSSTNTNTAIIQISDLPFALRNTSNTNGNMSLISFQDAAGFGNAQIGAVQVNQASHFGDLAFFTRGATFGERMRIRNDGNVGIGTASPTGILDIVRNQNANTFARIANSDAAIAGKAYFIADNGTNSVRLQQNGTGFGGVGASLAGEGLLYSTSVALALMADNASGVIKFAAGGSAEKMRLDATGRVGIGTPTPGFRLDVQGGQINAALGLCIAGVCKTDWSQVGGVSTGTAANISAGQFGQNTGGGNYTFPGDVTVNGIIHARYQDMAEWVPALHAMPAGTVAVLNPNQSNQVMASTQAYDTRVAGVISETPGLALGESGQGKVLVATTGRVRVKVEASRGPIAIGDLLVTSDIAGVAMKSEAINIGGAAIHRPGTLIGKALEPLNKGRGEILVLLSMQ